MEFTDTMLKSNTLCLIDGSSLLYRSYYGVRPLSTASGETTQAIYGFCRTIKKVIDELKPTYLVVAWDTKGPTKRQEVYTQYKQNRQAPPSDLITQKHHILKFLEIVNIAQTSQQGVEADDLISSIIKDGIAPNFTVITGDKDLHQLLAENVSVFDPFKQKLITKESFVQERGFEPEELLLYHSLLGDASDNIPGVKGVGKKTAEKLTQQYHTLENLYEQIESITPKGVKQKLIDSRENALLSKLLFTLQYEKLSVSLSDTEYAPSHWKKAVSFFEQLEIKPFAPNGVSLETTIEQKQETISHEFTHSLINTEKQLLDLVTRLQKQPIFALDTETTGIRPLHDQLVGISIAYNESHGYYIPFGHNTIEQQLNVNTVLNTLRPVFENKSIKKTLHNAKFDLMFLKQSGISVQGVSFDTLLAADLLRKTNEKISLKNLSLRILNEPMMTFEETLKKVKNFADVPLNDAALYASHDAVQSYKLYLVLSKELERIESLNKLFNEIEFPLMSVLISMESEGILLNTEVLNKIKEQVSERLVTIRTKIAACLEGGKKSIDASTVNFNSPKQLEEILFDILHLPVVKKSKSGKRSTDHEVLTTLQKYHPVPGLIIQYRELFKLISTYLEPLPNEISQRTGKIHTTYSQTITATGRLSSSQPNLQNIPVGKEFGSLVRNAFVADSGKKFISADYSQIELRILAHVSQDPALLDAFKHNKDIHRQTAAQICNVPEDEVTNEQRQIGKKINFSIMYGLTPFGLSRDLGISPSTAKEYIENYFKQYPGIKTWMDTVIDQAKTSGFVQTLLGRRRFVPGLHEKNKNLFEAEKRVAINTPIQGTAADLIKKAMLTIQEQIEAKKMAGRIILQIHDELVLECPENEVDELTVMVKKCMSNVIFWEVPLDISIRTGDNWGEASK